MFDSQTIKLASLAMHLAEYAVTQHPIDLGSVRGLTNDEEVRELLTDLRNGGLLPQPRDEKAVFELLDL